MCLITKQPDACGCNAGDYAGAAYSLKWPYLRKRAFKRRFFASMAAKMPKNRVFTAILAENMGYRACGDRYGRKGQQAGKWPYLRDVNTIKPAKKP